MTGTEERQVVEEQEADESKRVFHRTWFKAYTEDLIAALPIAMLTDRVFRRYVELLALASNDATPGEIHATVPQIAFHLRTTEDDVSAALDELSAIGAVFVENVVVYICNPLRHYAGEGLSWSDSKEGRAARKRAERARKKEAADTAQCHSDSHGDVTTQKENEYEYKNQYEYKNEELKVDYSPLPRREELIESSTMGASTMSNDEEDDLQLQERRYFEMLDLEADYWPTDLNAN